MPKREIVLVADDAHTGFLQRSQLFFGRSLPQSNVGVEARFAIALRVRRRLKPHGKRKESGIGRRPFRPFRVRIDVQTGSEARGRQGKCDHYEPPERGHWKVVQWPTG